MQFTSHLFVLRVGQFIIEDSLITNLESMIAKLESMIDTFGVNHSNNGWTTGTLGLNEYTHSTNNLP